ncbi:phosphoglucosamine mutase, partial [Candidatus Poribacteria bacterium]
MIGVGEPIVSVAGIRGVVGDSFTPELVLKVCSIYAELIGEGRVAIGRDTRPSSEMAFHAAVSAILSSGLDVVDLGVVPTPTALLAASNLQTEGCVIVTASHNPPEWNGLELSGRCGRRLGEEESERLKEMLEGRRKPRRAAYDGVGRLERYEGAIEDHMAKILSLDYIDPALIRERRLKVVVDACNGAGSLITPELLRRLG